MARSFDQPTSAAKGISTLRCLKGRTRCTAQRKTSAGQVAVRRVLLLTVEFDELHERTPANSQHFTLEMLVLTGLTLALAIALVLLRSRAAKAAAEPS